jgi:hypothetical protein
MLAQAQIALHCSRGEYGFNTPVTNRARHEAEHLDA